MEGGRPFIIADGYSALNSYAVNEYRDELLPHNTPCLDASSANTPILTPQTGWSPAPEPPPE